MVIKAYHAPHFSSNILSDGLLSSNFIVAFTDDIRPYNACFLIEKGTWKIFWETQKKNGLYTLHMNNSNSNMALTTFAMNVNKNPALERHGKTGNLGINCYTKLSHVVESVPFFEKSIVQQLDCVPCLKGKAHRAPLSQSGFVSTQPLEMIRIDI